MSKDFSKLSKEELLTLLKKQETALQSKQDQIELLRGENKKQAQEIKDKAQEIKELKAEKELVAETVGGYLETAKEVFELSHRTFAFDISTQKELLEGVGKLLEVLFNICRANKSLLQAFVKGNEKIGPKKARKRQNDADNRLKNKMVDAGALVVKSTQKISQEVRFLEMLAAAAERQVGQSPEEIDVREALKRQLLSKPLEENRKKGKVSRQENLPSKVIKDEAGASPVICPQCSEQMKEIGQVPSKLRALALRVSDLAVNLEQSKKIYCCRYGHYQVVYPPQAELAVLPERTISMPALLQACEMQAKGIPINKVRELIFRGFQLGGQTLYANIFDLYSLYLKPLEESIKQRMGENDAVLMDETYYQCLQQQGKGSCHPIDNPTDSESLILACRSSASSVKPFVWYSPLPTRSAASIKKTLGPNFHAQAIITDAYPGYEALLKTKEFKSCSHQICLYHFRRKCLADLGWQSMDKSVNEVDVEEAVKRLDSQITKLNPRMILMAVLKDLNAISDKENSLKREIEESDEQFARRADEIRNGAGENCRFYMDRIDRMMKSLSQSQTVKDNGKYKSAPQALYSASSVYYMNNRDQMRTFLEDARICCHTNDVERVIRSLTILRKNAGFAQSIKGIEVLCGLQSIWETGKLYGIDDIAGWLIEYTKELAVYCESKAWTEEAEKGNVLDNPSRQLRVDWKERWEELASGFNYTKYLPWTYHSEKTRN